MRCEMRAKNQKKICLLIACLISLVLTSGIMERRMEVVHAQMECTQKGLAKAVFRFHVIAESDSEKDQDIKLKVRDSVLMYMRTHMQDEERIDKKNTYTKDTDKLETTLKSQNQEDLKTTKLWVRAHKKELEQTANRVLKKEGVSYRAKAEIINCYFPEKWYGDVYFPEGKYETLRLVLGEGKGHNWWCVLYPSLCFTNATCAVVDEKGKQELKAALSAEEYEMVTATSEFKIKWFFLGKEHTKESDK